MEKGYGLYGWGVSGLTPDWLMYTNHKLFCNRIYYIIEEGAGYIYKDKEYNFLKNHCYVLPSNCSLSFYIIDKNFKHAYIDYTNPIILNYDHIVSFNIDDYSMIKRDIETFIHFAKIKNVVHADKNQYVTEYYSNKKRVSLLIEALFLDIKEAFPDTLDINYAVSDAINYIQRNFVNEISIAELAKSINLSESQLIRSFKSITGITPYQYIKNYRFDIALNMLSKGHSVNETAERVGFMSISAFSNSFKKHFGYPPSQINT